MSGLNVSTSSEIELVAVLDDLIAERGFALARTILDRVKHSFSLYQAYCALVDQAEAKHAGK